MFKAILLVALVAGAVNAQEANNEQNAAPEPYAYAYQTDTHQASEQRSPDGRVTGFYTMTDPADGRERRVEYYADASGFHAKVATNEVGTKSENSADVEVLASPPTEAQLVYQAPVAVKQQQQRVTYAQAPALTTTVQQVAPAVTTTVQQAPIRQSYAYVQQPAGYNVNYGYYPTGYGYGYNQGAYSNGLYGYYGNTNGVNYNYHTPAQYYSGVQGTRLVSSSVQPATYTVTGGQNVASRYVQGVQGLQGVQGGFRTVPVGGYTYSTGPAASTVTRTVSSSSSSSGANLGSGNLVLLKKK